LIEYLVLASPILVIIMCNIIRWDLKLFIKLYLIAFLICVSIQSAIWFLSINNGGILDVIGSLYMAAAFAFVFLHSWVKLGSKNTVIFFTITYLFGFTSELLGAKYGWFFGNYYYNLPSFFFGAEPFMTPISWAIIIYTVYTMTNLILSSLDGMKRLVPGKLIPVGIIILMFIASIDGLMAMNLDMIIDPVAVDPGVAGWVWVNGGPYYNIPISNFIGWFLVTFFATLIYRSYAVVKKNKENPTSLIDYGLPLLYLMYLVVQSALAVKLDRQELVLIGIATMVPFLLILSLSFFLDLTRLIRIPDETRRADGNQ
jgi:uncharacterized membrane protein